MRVEVEKIKTIIFFFQHINSSYYYNIHWLELEEEEQQGPELSQDEDGAIQKNGSANQLNLTGAKYQQPPER